MDVYAALLRHPWNDSLNDLKYMQYGALHILLNLSMKFEICRLIVSHNNVLQLCIQSLLQEKVPAGKYSMEDWETVMLMGSIVRALGLLNK